MSLSNRLRQLGARAPVTRKTPLWKGPCDDSSQGGISNSLLTRYLTCKERFRLYTMEGLSPPPSFHAPMDYGNMWHVCEEACIEGGDWKRVLTSYCKELCSRYPSQKEQIIHWYEMCKAQFPIYLDYWAKHPGEVARTPLLREQVFHLAYKLPSGRTVYLRGKFDGVDIAAS